MGDFDFEWALDRVAREPRCTAGRLLGEAERLFAERGFDGVTIRDVAGGAGVNVSTLHFHWRDKQTLYEAVCRLHARHVIAAVERVDAESAGPERLARWVDAVVELLVAHPALAPMALQSVSGPAPPDLAALFQHDVSIFRRLEAEVAKAVSPERARAGQPMLLVLCLFYFAIVAFGDPPLQRTLLGGSPYRSRQVRARIADFGHALVERFLGDA